MNKTEAEKTAAEIPHHEPALGPSKARRLYIILGAVVAALLLGYAIFSWLSAGKETTDDSQVAADIVPVAPRVAGQIAAVHVTDNQLVRKGQLIAEIDPADAQVKYAAALGDLETARAQATQADAAALVSAATARGGYQAAQAAVAGSQQSVGTSSNAIAEAEAGVVRARANAEKASLDYKRAQELGDKGDISRAQVDAARASHETADAELAQAQARLATANASRHLAESNVEQAQGRLQQSSPVEAQVAAARASASLAHAKVKSAEAAAEAARLALSYTKIYAPADGLASKLSVHPGALVAPGQPIVQLVPRQTYVVANFKETQLKDMRPGQRAVIRIDALGSKEFEGKVESLSGGTGASFSLLPPDNASGNFVKVVQRVPVKVSWDGPAADRLPVGSSAEVTVYTK